MDPYSILGVPKTASQEEIKKAYRRLAMEFHPDRNDSPKAEERFKQVSEAYSAVGTESARREYEESRKQTFRSHNPFDDFFSGLGGSPRGGSWEDLFGAFRGQNPHHRPFIIRASLTVTLEEIAFGARRSFQLDGQRLDFQVPSTARPGQLLKINLQNGQQLHMDVTVAKHKLFSLAGDDLVGFVTVPVGIAVAGGEVKAPTLDSNIMLRIPPGTNSHSKLRAKNVGLPLQAGGRSSIVYEVKIDTKSATPSFLKWSSNI